MHVYAATRARHNRCHGELFWAEIYAVTPGQGTFNTSHEVRVYANAYRGEQAQGR
jgi:hypothetical protein